MSTQIENSKRIAKNTVLLYMRTVFTMLINLYASRMILNVLGIEDYGIYNVVGGFVAMFSLISASLTGATQRFITFELGKKDSNRSQDIFSASLTIHLLLAVVVFILLESVGVWFLNVQMNIAEERLHAANWVFQFSVLTFIVNLISIPYNATIIAHERMRAFAYIGVLEAVLKLAIVFVLFLVTFDKLIMYGFLMLCIAIFIRWIYGYYCEKNIENSKFKFSWNKILYKQIANFAGWTFIGASSNILMTQGANILINIFYGVTLNAARGIAVQVEHAVNQFVTNFMTALNPQITKSYAANNYSYMMNLIFKGARFSYYLMFMISFPVILEARNILVVWLKIVPEYTVIFVQLALVYSVLQTLSNTLITAMLATGKIKRYQIIVGGIQMMNFPITYLVYKLGGSPEWSYIIAIVLTIFCLIFRLYLLKNMICLPVERYIREVLVNVIFVTISAVIIPCLLHRYLEDGLINCCIVVSVSIIVTMLSIYFLGLNSNEKSMLLTRVNSMCSKLKNNDNTGR